EGAIVDGFRLGDFAVRPAPDFFGRGQADANSIEIGHRVRQVKGARTVQGVPSSPSLLSCSRRLAVAFGFPSPRALRSETFLLIPQRRHPAGKILRRRPDLPPGRRRYFSLPRPPSACGPQP